MLLPGTARPMRVSEEFVRAKCAYFVDVQLWPVHAELNYEGWLRNFGPDEMEYAVHLLNAFQYFTDRLINQMFAAAFQRISSHISDPAAPPLVVQNEWRQFLDEVVVTYVEGEEPSVTDSGYTFARKARQILGLPEHRISGPAEALLDASRTSTSRHIVFVDDFVGTGDQFVSTWERNYTLPGEGKLSFSQLVARAPINAYYCTVMNAKHGQDRITHAYPDVTLVPAHVLLPQYSAVTGNSYIWPDHLRATALDFLQQASERAGIPLVGPKQWKGYKGLGLTIAFSHSVPDATLPLFYWEENGWTPLLRRS
jgi:hypothetical protein